MFILLAEDDAVNQKLFEAMITRLGHQIDIAENGLVAVEKFKKNSYDLVFMDISMPIMCGLDATREIRKYETALNTKNKVQIIAFTTNTMPGFQSVCQNAGMDNMLVKPITKTILENFINTLQFRQVQFD
jgi:CheY-like chemotaxis protein